MVGLAVGATGTEKLLQNCGLGRNRSTAREPSLVSHPHPSASPTGRGALGKPLYEFPLPLGEGQGEGRSWHDLGLTKNFTTVSGGRSLPGIAPMPLLLAIPV